jgi:hypothetical protein
LVGTPDQVLGAFIGIAAEPDRSAFGCTLYPVNTIRGALYLQHDGSRSVLAYHSQSIPGTGGWACGIDFKPIAFAPEHKVLCSVSADNGTLGGQMALLLADSEGLSRIMVAPDLAAALPEGYSNAIPALPAGVSFDNQVAFAATVRYENQARGAVFGWTESTGLFPVLLPGTQVELSPGDVRLTTSAYLVADSAEGGPWGHTRCFDDQGRALLYVGFSDDSTALILVQFIDLLTGRFPCADVQIQPRDTSVVAGQTAHLDVLASGQAVQYSWRRGGIALNDGATPAGSIVAGSHSPHLQIQGSDPSDSGLYTCVVSNTCHTEESDPATLDVICPADFNRSGGVPDDADIAAFFAAWNSGDESADLNGSGGTPDDADVAYFFLRWNLGC